MDVKKKYQFKNLLNTRLGFGALLTLLFWMKSIFAYFCSFRLGIEDAFQYFILFVNPFATTIGLLGVALYIRRSLASYLTVGIIYALLSVLLLSNVVYYREFSDFLTVNTILGTGSVSAGLGEAAIKLFNPSDLVFVIDFILLPVLFFLKKIKMDVRPSKIRLSFAVTAISVMLFSGNLFLAESSRPELLNRTFSHDYLVKYLGIGFFTGYDGYQAYQALRIRAKASPNDLDVVRDYVRRHYAAPVRNLFGIARGRNVIYIHLESFQQFLIDYRLRDENNQEHVVTPFLNQLFHSNDTASFDNFFHQVKSGKTSDAEHLLENSLFGLEQGPLFNQLGDKNTFNSMSQILKQKAGYTSAVFHGNYGTFWNRNGTYKRLGVDNFFDASYFKIDPSNSSQYGANDKDMFKQSVKFLEHLQQPFFAKFLTLSNHYPYSPLVGEEAGFPSAQTGDETINGYFATANQLDEAIREFFVYLKESGLLDNCMIVLYGDHYGISNARNPDLAPLLGKDENDWHDFDDASLQRTPLMIHMSGSNWGRVHPTYAGQIDVVPTVLNLLGIQTKNYLHLGQDLFSPERDDCVTFRDGNFITSKYLVLGSNKYNTKTGEELDPEDEAIQKEISLVQKKAEKQLSISDMIVKGDLLRFYDKTQCGLDPVNPNDYHYKDSFKKLLKIEKEKGKKSTSLFSQRGRQSTVDLYETKSYQEAQESLQSQK